MSDWLGDVVNDIKDTAKEVKNWVTGTDPDTNLAKDTATAAQHLLDNPNDSDWQSKFAADVNQLHQKADKDGSFGFYNKMNTEFQKLESQGFPSIQMDGDGGITAMPKRDPSTAAPEGARKIEDSHDTGFKVSSEVVDHSAKGQYGWRKEF